MKNSFFKLLGIWFLFGIVLSTNVFAQATPGNALIIKITWTSGIERTDFDLFVKSPDGKICNYGGEGGSADQSDWGCVHIKDNLGKSLNRSYEAFQIDLDKMDWNSTKNNLLNMGDASDYKFWISRYLGPNIKVRFSYGNSSNCNVNNADDCPKGNWDYQIPGEKVVNAVYSVKYIPKTSPYSEFVDLRKSRWGQPNKLISFQNAPTGPYHLGCTTVAVGQAINYYLKSGFTNGWLDSMGNNVVVYPRFNGQEYPGTYPGIATYDGYQYRDNASVTAFLEATALLLDSDFKLDGTGFHPYTVEPAGSFKWDDKIETILRDRFRMSSRSFTVAQDQGMRGVYANYLKAKTPLIIGMGFVVKETAKDGGHAVLMDGYRVNRSTGVSEFRMNFGWGDGPGSGSCSDMWFPFTTNSLDLSCDERFRDVHIFGVVAARPTDDRPITP